MLVLFAGLVLYLVTHPAAIQPAIFPGWLIRGLHGLARLNILFLLIRLTQTTRTLPQRVTHRQ
jgi:hypothetical protein